ncbi:MAG TPA: SUF system NifU family Fe-S cluster assembly protein [Myxococcota bacterium]|jgi:nitrogen fixation NifU-like protein
MSDLRELYQSVILDHNKAPRNLRRPASANRTAEGRNPLCGDQLTVFLEVENDVVKDAAFQGSGCAISTASASLMTEGVKGRRVDEVEKLFEGFHRLLTSDPASPAEDEGLGKLAVFSGVREFPVRVKCATLAWHTLRAALHGSSVPASTE